MSTSQLIQNIMMPIYTQLWAEKFSHGFQSLLLTWLKYSIKWMILIPLGFFHSLFLSLSPGYFISTKPLVRNNILKYKSENFHLHFKSKQILTIKSTTKCGVNNFNEWELELHSLDLLSNRTTSKPEIKLKYFCFYLIPRIS